MSRRYRPQEKATALQTLADCHWDVAVASRRIGIPVRTLREWRLDYEKTSALLSPPLPPPTPSAAAETPSTAPSPTNTPLFENDMDALAYMREQILAELVNISANIKDSFAHTPPAYRLQVVSGLLDRLAKLDDRLRPYQPPPIVRFWWRAGLYIITPTDRHGPFEPEDLPPNWREVFGPGCQLEIFWGGNQSTLVPEGPFMDQILNPRAIDDNKERPLVNPGDDEYWERPGWREELTKSDYDIGYREPTPERSW